MSGDDAQGGQYAAALERLEGALGYAFTDRDQLERALCHSSFANERVGGGAEFAPALESNERLEFLGDAVLALVVGEALFEAKPDWAEGDLTRALHAIVNGSSLTELGRKLGLGEAILLGKTEEASQGREKASILEDAAEAVIGAMYLDGGLPVVRAFVGRFFATELAADAVRVERDPKTELQETLMKEVGEFPTYRLTGDTGVEGDDVRFEIQVSTQGTPLASGIGRTKRMAEKAAADAALVLRDHAEAEEA